MDSRNTDIQQLLQDAARRREESIEMDTALNLEHADDDLDEFRLDLAAAIRATPPEEQLDEREPSLALPLLETTLEEPVRGRRIPQTIAFLWLFFIANCSSNARNPILPQPWGSVLDYATVNPNRELGVALSYLFSSDIHDLAERLRLEGGNHAGRGFLAGVAKILVGTLPPAAFGLGVGMLLKHFENEIEQSPALTVLTSTYLSRIIAANLSTLIYIGTRKGISHCFPVPTFKFNMTPPLHWLQRISGFGFRIYCATSEWAWWSISLGNFTKAPQHHPHFPLGATVVDQINVNLIQRIALNYHPYNDNYPFARTTTMQTLAEENLAIERINHHHQSDRMAPTIQAFEEGRSNVYSTTHTPVRCDNVKVVVWYSTRFAVVMAIGYVANLAASQLIQDKEELNDQLRLTYTALICVASAGAERLYEVALPWLIRKVSSAVSSCWSSLFSRRREAAIPEEEEALTDDFAPDF